MHQHTGPLGLGVYMGCCKPLLWGSGAMFLETLAISLIPRFQIACPFIICWPNLCIFENSFCLSKTCMVTSSPHKYSLNGNTKWQVMWTYRNFFSKSHVHAIFCWPKRWWSQINRVLILSHDALSLNAMKSVGYQIPN